MSPASRKHVTHLPFVLQSLHDNLQSPPLYVSYETTILHHHRSPESCNLVPAVQSVVMVVTMLLLRSCLCNGSQHVAGGILHSIALGISIHASEHTSTVLVQEHSFMTFLCQRV